MGENPLPNEVRRTEIAKILGIPERKVMIWFQNKRQRMKQKLKYVENINLKEENDALQRALTEERQQVRGGGPRGRGGHPEDRAGPGRGRFQSGRHAPGGCARRRVDGTARLEPLRGTHLRVALESHCDIVYSSSYSLK